MYRSLLLTTFLFAVGVWSSASSASSTSISRRNGIVASAYFEGYRAASGFPLSKIPWDRYTDVKYSFALTASDGSLNLSRSSPDQLPIFVKAAKQHNVKALVSVGGWTGSRYFSTAFGSPQNRTAFVNECLEFVEKENLDGLDFDWEYPNHQGIGCNTINKDDTANFAAFLKEMREKQKKRLYLTAATSLLPWSNSAGVASGNGSLSSFAETLDYLMIMGYDIFGTWTSTAGPNAPLASTCDSRNKNGGIAEAVGRWVQAGIPAHKLVLGVASYGHGYSVNSSSAFTTTGALNAFPFHNKSRSIQTAETSDAPSVDECGQPEVPSNTITFKSMIQDSSFLDGSGRPLASIASGFDNCSQTPFLYNKTSQVWVSFDNAASFAAKGRFIASSKMAGFGIWEASGDHENVLVDAIRSAILKNMSGAPDLASGALRTFPALVTLIYLILLL